MGTLSINGETQWGTPISLGNPKRELQWGSLTENPNKETQWGPRPHWGTLKGNRNEEP